ncbi:hypothetical protein [Arthrobacter sp. AZCC_0090]|uniref:hypothetical protein n=1 Tax=Arthrobacter sp. AZCC_0090 TaxID=2735881 RepID=UPI00160C1957|nr:hypothetical protein [Arthrobacter sp. AZCC_0090]MBB6405134.1 hypothetical protein [Arthrobacter sp. AZCC_0090]
MSTDVDQHEIPQKLLADASEPEIDERGLPGSTRGFGVIAPQSGIALQAQLTWSSWLRHPLEATASSTPESAQKQ